MLEVLRNRLHIPCYLLQILSDRVLLYEMWVGSAEWADRGRLRDLFLGRILERHTSATTQDD